MPSMTGLTFATFLSFLSGSDEALGTFTFHGATSGVDIYNLAVSGGVQDDIQAGALLGLHVEAADSTISYVFHSRDFGTVSDRPMLIITAESGPVPAVSTWGLIVFTLGILTAATIILRRIRLTNSCA